MGLLDDAIKEHLELKRKHGAPEQEVQRQEEEALGPVRREAAPQPESVEAADTAAGDGEHAAPELGAEQVAEAGSEADAPSAEDQLFDGEAFGADERAPVDELVPEEQPAPVDEPAPLVEEEPVAEEAPVPDEPPASEPGADEPVLEADPEAPEPAAGPADTPSHGLEPVDETPHSADPGATVEYDPFADEELEEHEEPAASEDDDDEGDVLEDTPDFLQETPEHDRLWFEQKPPRDFDFE